MPDTKTTPTAPKAGQVVLIDGLAYVLTAMRKPAINDQGQTVHIRRAVRPGQPAIEDAAAKVYDAKMALKAALAKGNDAASQAAQKTLDAAVAHHTQLVEADKPLKANYNYKLDHQFVESDLVWCEQEQLLADLKAQTDDLIRGNRNLAAWAEGASAVQAEVISRDHKAGAWTLAGRHLLKPPVQRRMFKGAPADAVIVPQRASEAAEFARLIMANKMVYDQTKEV